MYEVTMAAWRIREANERIKGLIAQSKVYARLATVFAEESVSLTKKARALADKLSEKGGER